MIKERKWSKLVAYVIAVVMNMERWEIIGHSDGAAVLKELFAIYAASNVNITMNGIAVMIWKVARKCVNLYSQIEKTKEQYASFKTDYEQHIILEQKRKKS